MKFLFVVLFSIILGVAFSRRVPEDQYFPKAKECIVELGINEKNIFDIVNDDLTVVEGNTMFNTLCECILKKLKAVDENNLIKIDVIKPLMVRYIDIVDKDNTIVDAQQFTNDAIESCKDVQANGTGDQLVKLWNCFVNYILSN